MTITNRKNCSLPIEWHRTKLLSQNMCSAGLFITKGAVAKISTQVLSATDPESNDDNILFKIEAPYAASGEIVIRRKRQPSK